MYVCIHNSVKYPVRWQKLLGSARCGSTAFSYQNCVITNGWRLMRAGYRTYFHTLYDDCIYITIHYFLPYIYIYIYTYILLSSFACYLWTNLWEISYVNSLSNSLHPRECLNAVFRISLKYLLVSGCLLWHIKPCRLFNARSRLYISYDYNDPTTGTSIDMLYKNHIKFYYIHYIFPA